MADLKEYRYIVNGVPTTGMLDEHDAARLNATPVTAAADNAGSSDTVAVAGKARSASNTARTSSNKAR